MKVEAKTGTPLDLLTPTITHCENEIEAYAVITVKRILEEDPIVNHDKRKIQVVLKDQTLVVETDEQGRFYLHAITKPSELQLDLKIVDYEFTESGLGRTCSVTVGKSVPTYVVVLKRMLVLVKVDHHFVPGPEKEAMHHKMYLLSAGTVKLQVRSGEGNELIYDEPLADVGDGDDKIFEWDGKAKAGSLKDKLINPLHGPFRAKLVSSLGPVSAELEFHVLYHSLKLRMGTYTADERAPPDTTLEWVQYRLNELGYFAGPLDGVMNDQTKRALRRYTREIPGFGEIDIHNDTVDNYLKLNDRQCQLFEHPASVNATAFQPGCNSKIYVDHNYFYTKGLGDNALEMGHPDGHADMDRQKLDRFQFPIQAEVLLLSKADTDGSKRDQIAGMGSPGAVGPVKVEWIFTQPAPEQPWAANTVDIPSFALNYVPTAVAGANCPVAQGGVHGNNGPADYFLTGADIVPPFESETQGQRVFSTVYVDEDELLKSGKTGVLFRGSYIAGDRFQISAKISFEGLGCKGRVEPLHTTLPQGILESKTGELTLWRRIRIAKIICWPAGFGTNMQRVTNAARNADWASFAARMAEAHCEVDVGNIAGLVTDYTTYLANVDFKARLTQAAKNAYQCKDEEILIDSTGVLPIKYPEKGFWQKAEDYNAILREFGSQTWRKNGFAFITELGKAVSGHVATKERPGLIFVWGLLSKPAKYYTTTAEWYERNVEKPTETPTDKTLCVGAAGGVVLVDHYLLYDFPVPTSLKQDAFLLTHEGSHCRYLIHHEGPGPRPLDHDTEDHNCMMSYDHSIPSRPGLSWGKSVPNVQPRFCGKCILKLRGWKVQAGVPANH